MKNKIKKTMGMIAVVLLLTLIAPLVSAITIQNILNNIRANPSTYYILHDRDGVTESEMVTRISEFATSLGISTISNTVIPGKNFILVSESLDQFRAEYYVPLGYSFAQSYEDGVDYLVIYLTVDDGAEYYSAIDGPIEIERLDLDGNGGFTNYELEYNELDVILDYLLGSRSINVEEIKVVDGKVVVPSFLTCIEFEPYDLDWWRKDEYLYQGGLVEDECVNYYLYELTCSNVDYPYWEKWTCPRGCSDGRCIYSMGFLIKQYELKEINLDNFERAVGKWLDREPYQW